MSTELIQPYMRALRQRRGGIAVTCSLIILCGIVQLVTFGLVHYTDLRHEQVAPQPAETAPLIITERDRQAATAQAQAAQVPPPTMTETASLNAIASKYEIIFASTIGICRAVALIAALLLTGQLLVAFIVAGQAQLMALPRVAGASCTAMLLALALAPWSDVFPALAFPGALPSYQYMIDTAPQAAADASLASSAAVLGANIILPAMVIVLAALILLRFHVAITDDCLTVAQYEEHQQDETNTPALAMEAVRKARAQIRSSGDTDQLHPAMRPAKDELPKDVQSILSKSARRGKTAKQDDDDDGPPHRPPTQGGDDRRATQVGSIEPLRRPI